MKRHLLRRFFCAYHRAGLASAFVTIVMFSLQISGLYARADWRQGMAYEEVVAAFAPLKDRSFNEFKEDPALRKQWWDLIWKVWDGSPAYYRPDFDDFNRDRYFDAPPEPFRHPRIFVREEQLPEIRTRLATSRSGQAFWPRYRAECEKLYADSPAGRLFQAFLHDEKDQEFEALFSGNAYEMSLLMMWESLRVLIDDDREAGERLARATANYARHLQGIYEEKGIGETHYIDPDISALPDYMKEKTRGVKQYQSFTGLFQEYNIILIYDFAYRYMTGEQRDTVRSLIRDLSSDVWIHGMGEPSTGGNWGPHHWKGGNAAIAIEGEPGYDPDTVEGLRQVMTSFYATDFTLAGGVWEGLGKGALGTIGLPVAAQRGWDIAASQPVRRTAARMTMHATLPGMQHIMTLGGLGTSYGDVGSRAFDMLIMKYFYPDDPVIDYLYRACMGEDYAWLSDFRFNRHYFGIRFPLVILLCATDYKDGRSLEAARGEAISQEGMSFFCPQFSTLITREDWSPDAGWLYFFARSINYGHTRNDRGHFSFAGLGRQWSVYNFGRGSSDHAHSYDAQNCSVMTVDGFGTLGQPVKMIAHAESPAASFASADLKHAWDWREHSHNNTSLAINPLTAASMQPLVDEPQPEDAVPFSLKPHWRTPGQPLSPDYRVPHRPVRHAYRTAGLVRPADSSTSAYALILDDMEVDGQPRMFTWNMALPSDVELASVDGNRIMLAETGGVRRCLVEVLQSDAAGRGLAARSRVRVEHYDGGISWSRGVRRLTISVNVPSVRFKVLLYPFREGEPLPVTVWQGDELAVRLAGQQDRFVFEVDGEGMTVFDFARSDGTSFSLKPVHIPIPGKPPGPAYARGYDQGASGVRP
ncbi:MAG: hypothetical protein ACO398_07975 [Kiritimatiellia bacterium]